MRFRVSKSVDLIELRNEIVHELLELRDESSGKITDLSTNARIRGGKARAGQQLEEIVDFLALGEGIEKNGHRAEIERHRAQAEEVRERREVSQQIMRMAFPRGGSSQPISFSTASA